LLAGALVLARSQGPGDGWSMAPAPDRSVKLLYWKLAGQSEIWTRITPKAVDTPAKQATGIPASLVFSAIFRGEITRLADVKRAPDELTVLAQPSPLARVLTTSLLLASGRDVLFDLAKQTSLVQLSAPCDGCGVTAARARIHATTIEQIAAAPHVTCEVLGFTCVLERADLDALSKFARCTRLIPGRCDAN
jgi:hypothetical protein